MQLLRVKSENADSAGKTSEKHPKAFRQAFLKPDGISPGAFENAGIYKSLHDIFSGAWPGEILDAFRTSFRRLFNL